MASFTANMVSFVETMDERLKNDPFVYEPLKVLGVLSDFTQEEIFSLLRYEKSQRPHTEWVSYFLAEDEDIESDKVEEMVGKLCETHLVWRNQPHSHRPNRDCWFFVSTDVTTWVWKYLPISDRVDIAKQAIETIAGIQGRCSELYVSARMQITWAYACQVPISHASISFSVLLDWLEAFDLVKEFGLLGGVSGFIIDKYEAWNPGEEDEREDFTMAKSFAWVFEMRDEAEIMSGRAQTEANNVDEYHCYMEQFYSLEVRDLF